MSWVNRCFILVMFAVSMRVSYASIAKINISVGDIEPWHVINVDTSKFIPAVPYTLNCTLVGGAYGPGEPVTQEPEGMPLIFSFAVTGNVSFDSASLNGENLVPPNKNSAVMGAMCTGLLS